MWIPSILTTTTTTTTTATFLLVWWTSLSLSFSVVWMVNAHQELRRGSHHRHLESSSKKSCKSCSTFIETTEPLEDEEDEEDSGSNDGSFLEHICMTFSRYQGRNCTKEEEEEEENGGDSVQNGRHLLCPNSYERSKICAAVNSSSTTISFNVAINNEYCTPLFAPFEDETDRELCITLCNGYFLKQDNGCCDLLLC